MSLNWPRLAQAVDRHDRFLLTTHIRPDGDALGSELGMAGLLRQKGKSVRIVNASTTPERLRFMDPQGAIEHWGDPVTAADLAAIDVILILDTSSWQQLGAMAEFIRGCPAPRMVIDHHLSQDDLNAELFKDPGSEACGSLVFGAVKHLGGTLTPEIARALYVAIAMDTGWFRFSTTRPETYRIAAELVDAGAEPSRLYRALHEQNTLPRLKLMGVSLERLTLACQGQAAYSSIRREDFARTGAVPQDTEDLVDYTLSIAGVRVGLIFIEQLRGGVKISFRSRDGIDCNRLAARFGGGGHAQAAGATLPDPLSEAQRRVLGAVEAELEQAAQTG